MVKKITNDYWGEIKYKDERWICKPKKRIESFSEDVKIMFDLDEESAPSEDELATYQEVFDNFLSNQGTLKPLIEQKLFEFYQENYAETYENDELGLGPLNIKNKEDHNKYIKGIENIELRDENTIKIIFDYELDEENDVAILIIDGQIGDVGGVADL